MKPFATLGSEISKVRERVRRGAEALRPAKVASDVRDQRDRLLAKLGEQTFRLIAERKLQVPKVLQDSVEKLAALLGVQLPDQNDPMDRATDPESRPTLEDAPPAVIERAIEGVAAVASDPLQEPVEVDEPSIGDEQTPSVRAPEPRVLPAADSRPAPPAAKASPAKTQKNGESKPRPKKKGAKRRKGR